MNNRILIVSGGKVEEETIRFLVSNYEYSRIIGVDKGLEMLDLLEINPDIICGDFDTVNSIIFNKYRTKEDCIIKKFPPMKDFTDTHLAVDIAIEEGATLIDICGGTGSRIDHLLGNLGVVAYALTKGVSVYMWDSNNRLRMINNSVMLKKDQCFGDYLSLIPYGGETTGVTLKGFKYNLENATLKLEESLGVSNEIIEDSATIEFKNGRIVVVESRD